jgi:hypothetical protein
MYQKAKMLKEQGKLQKLRGNMAAYLNTREDRLRNADDYYARKFSVMAD